ncbi:MAG: lactonase family protein [Planctomycetes bacterium]|nr:lactonase family protein [Planctomycetota bacterium]
MGVMFAFDPKSETVTDLGPNFRGGDYCADMVLSPDERFIYYAPGSHGSGAAYGAPVVQYDIASKRRKVLAFLGPMLRERLRYNIGGSFNLKIAADGGRLLATFNGAPWEEGARKAAAFGLPCIVMLDIPAGER